MGGCVKMWTSQRIKTHIFEMTKK